MRRWLLLFLFPFYLFPGTTAQVVVLSDDFEDTTLTLWQTNSWGVSSAFSISPTHSFTESPAGNYPNNARLTATTITGANLSSWLGARLTFWARYQIEPAFDYCYIEATRDGDFWIPLGILTGINPAWDSLYYDLGAFAGLPDVRLRFRFFSDPQTSDDGLYLDNLRILGLPNDESGPLIIHRGPIAYEGTPNSRSVYAEIWDASGVSQEHLFYRLDGGPLIEALHDSVVGERYYHTLPAQQAGVLVQYFFTATDAAPQMHVAISDTFAYLAGEMLIQDDGLSENIFFGPPGYQAAVRFQRHNAGYLTSALMRIYLDSLHPLDSVAVSVLQDSSGLPGSLLAGPFIVYPVNTPENPEAWTWIDLRPAAIVAPDTFHINVEFATTGASPLMAISADDPSRFRRSSYNAGAGFVADTTLDYHLRVVVGQFTPDTLSAPTNLTGTLQGDLLILSWSPPSGWDVLLGYELQRQETTFAQIPAPATHYTDTLTNLPAGTYTYRVRAWYSFGFSPLSDPWDFLWNPSGIVEPPASAKVPSQKCTVYPNPTNGVLCVDLSGGVFNSGNDWILFDILGREVSRWPIKISGSKASFNLPLPDYLPAGIYILEARSGDHLPVQRLKVVYLP